jgi:membrane fusion protein (multidrug efflux system)
MSRQVIHNSRNHRAPAAAALVLLLAAACSRDNANAAAGTPSAMLVGPENIAVIKAEDIRTGPVISGTLTPEQQATVRAEIAGAVLQTTAEQGERVTKGQALARIDDSAVRDQMLSARSAVSTAQNTVDLNERQLVRAEALLKAGAIAERDVEIARNQVSAAQTQLANARAQLANAQKQLDKTTIAAPFAGIVSARQVSAGDVVSPGNAMYTVVNPATMRLEASVPADQLAAVRVGQPVEFAVNGYPTRRFTGRVIRINPIADPATRQVRIIVSLPNQGGVLVGGLFAEGHVSSESRTAPIVPISAVDERSLRPFVVRIKGGVVQKVDVELGIRDAATETVEIRSGVQPGDTILLGAARGISPGTPVKVSATSDTTKR